MNTNNPLIRTSLISALSVGYSLFKKAENTAEYEKLSSYANKVDIKCIYNFPEREKITVYQLPSNSASRLKICEIISAKTGGKCALNPEDPAQFLLKTGSTKVGNVSYSVFGSRIPVQKTLAGKTTFITGGNAGIGKATAKLLHEKGAEVYITGRNSTTLDATVKEIGEGCYGVQGDVSTVKGCEALFDSFKVSGKKIDSLFVNAGIFAIKPLSKVTEEDYDAMFGINTKGALFTIQKALPYLNEGAVIILNSSIASEAPDAKNGLYSASKISLERFAVSLASELADRKIRVVTIAPGLTQTDIFYNALGSQDAAKKFIEGTIPSIPLGRASTPEEMADAVLFLILNESANAETFHINGGLRNASGNLVPEGVAQ